MTSKKIARLALLATVVAAGVLSLGGVAAATTGFWATPTYGERYAPQASVPNGCTSPDRTCTWVKSSDNLLYYHKTDGTDVNLTTGGGGGTQGGSTTASHVPYASGANTLADGELSFNSGTHTYSVVATTVVDFSASASTVKAEGFLSSSGTPSCTLGTYFQGTGGSPSCTVVGNNEAFKVTVVTGGTLGAGPAAFTITLANSVTAPNGIAASLSAGDQATSDAFFKTTVVSSYYQTSTTTTWTWNVASNNAAATGATYKFIVLLRQY